MFVDFPLSNLKQLKTVVEKVLKFQYHHDNITFEIWR